jgi:hypothetical protein
MVLKRELPNDLPFSRERRESDVSDLLPRGAPLVGLQRRVRRVGWGCALARSSQHCLDLFNGKRLPIQVNDGVAVWADRTHVSYRIYPMFMTHLGKFTQMVNVDEPFSDSVISLSKLETAHEACRTVLSETLGACCRVPLVCVD